MITGYLNEMIVCPENENENDTFMIQVYQGENELFSRSKGSKDTFTVTYIYYKFETTTCIEINIGFESPGYASIVYNGCDVNAKARLL